MTHDERVSGLLAANNSEVERRRRAEGALRNAVSLVRHYQRLHEAKGTTEGHLKARTNAMAAEHFEDVLAGVEWPREFPEIKHV